MFPYDFHQNLLVISNETNFVEIILGYIIFTKDSWSNNFGIRRYLKRISHIQDDYGSFMPCN